MTRDSRQRLVMWVICVAIAAGALAVAELVYLAARLIGLHGWASGVKPGPDHRV